MGRHNHYRQQILTGAALLAITAMTQAHQPTAVIGGQDNADIGNNTWVRANTGGMTSHQNIMSYSGGWYDPVNHQFCIFGGGHWDYSGNEVWCFDIAAQNWVRLYAPDVVTTQGGNQGAYQNYNNIQYPGALFNPAEESIADANPMSKHTYDQMEYVDGLGILVYGGYAWGDGGQGWCPDSVSFIIESNVCRDTWAFNFNTSKWLYLYEGTANTRAPDQTAGEGASAYSTQEGLLYVQQRSNTWTYNPRTNRWTQISTTGSRPGYIHATMEYDPHRNVFYVFGGNTYSGDNEVNHYSLFRLDPVTRVWSNLSSTATGTAPSSGSSRGPGLAFDTRNDVLVIFRGDGIWIYHPGSNSWSRPSTPTTIGGSVSGESNLYGRFRYDPVNNGFWLLRYDRNTSFYRYQTTATPPAPVVSMIANPPTLENTQNIDIIWGVSNASSCTASGDWSGSKASAGTQSITVVGDSATFTLSCTGSGGNADRTITISDEGIGGGGSSTCPGGCGTSSSSSSSGGTGSSSSGGTGSSSSGGNPDNEGGATLSSEGGGAFAPFWIFMLASLLVIRRPLNLNRRQSD